VRGQEALIATRMAGYRPQVPVVLHCPLEAWPFQDAPSYVQIAPGERIDRLDLRFVVGLPVVVVGENEERVKTLCKAAQEAGCTGTLGIASEKPQIAFQGLCWASGDTDWVTNWPKEECFG